MIRILIILLLLISSMGFSQSAVGLNNKDAAHRVELTWAESMAHTYININNHVDYGRAQEDSMAARLSEDYIVTTFGPDGLDHKKADFFIYLENTNDSTLLTTRTVTKSGDSLLMWDYGDTTYYQNNLPAHVNNGAISVTDYDLFDSVTVFQLNTNSFDGGLFELNYYMPNLTDFRIQSNNFTGTLTALPSAMDAFYVNNNNFSSPIPDISGLTSLRWFHVYRNPLMTGTVTVIPNADFREMQAFEMALTGTTVSAFSEDLITFRIQEHEMSALDLNNTTTNMALFYTETAPKQNLTVGFTGGLMGYVNDTATDDRFQALDDAFKAEGKTLTFGANIHPGAFPNGGVVFTFDDGLKNTLRITKPIFDEYDINGTCYHTIAHVDEPTSYGDSGMSWTETHELADAGWTIGSHGCTHVNFGSLNATQLNEQITCIEDSFAIHGFTDSLHFCYPFGGYSAASEDSLQDNKFLSSRIVDNSYHVGTSDDSWLLPGINFENPDGDFDHYKRYIDFAYENKVVVVFLSHGVYEDCDEQDHDNCVEISLLRAIIEYAQDLDLDILTIAELYDKLD